MPAAEPKRPHSSYRSWMPLVGSLLAVIVLSVAVRQFTSNRPAEAQAPPTKTAKGDETLPRPGRPQHDVMAIVNGKDISRTDLANACVERFGEEVLESMVNKRLIMHHCNKRGITVTNAEIEEEVDRMAKRFRLGREQWLELLEGERGVTAAEYKRDILWPTIALRKLAASDLQVSPEEVQKAYDREFGPAVQTRLIVVNDAQQAAKIHRELTANPQEFVRVAMAESVDVNSASIGGLIQPIRKHTGDPAIEQAVFALQPGQLTPVLPVADQFVILKCERLIEKREMPIRDVQDKLTESIREEKLREVAGVLFQKLQGAATIQNVYNDPKLREAMPGVVATINGEAITMQQLGQEAVLRHGETVLEIEISHRLLEQELLSAGATITQQDLDAEIAHAATLAGVLDNAGQPNVEKWVKMATDEQDVSYAMYIRDSVWPSAALKKLTSSAVQVTQEDLEHGYAANFGERVQCRAIVALTPLNHSMCSKYVPIIVRVI